jgi:uncharacterized protein YbjQ (UPF0145 family)
LLFWLSFFFTSCTTTTLPVVDYTYPHNGTTNNAGIVVKDYESLGIIFIKSTETIDSKGNHSGSKITYEMLMKEAQKLNGDDVINIKIDVNQIEKRSTDKYGYSSTETTYNYTASALVIKYTNPVSIENRAGATQDISNSMVISKTSEISKGKMDGKTIGILLGVLGVTLGTGLVVLVGLSQ